MNITHRGRLINHHVPAVYQQQVLRRITGRRALRTATASDLCPRLTLCAARLKSNAPGDARKTTFKRHLKNFPEYRCKHAAFRKRSKQFSKKLKHGLHSFLEVSTVDTRRGKIVNCLVGEAIAGNGLLSTDPRENHTGLFLELLGAPLDFGADGAISIEHGGNFKMPCYASRRDV